MKKQLLNSKGWASIAVAMGMVAIGLLVMSTSYVVNEGSTQKANETNRDRAAAYASAGIERTLKVLESGDSNPNQTLQFSNGTATVSVVGNQVTSVGRSDIASVTYTVTSNTYGGSCITLDCGDIILNGNILSGLKFNKGCMAHPNVSELKVKWTPDNGEKITKIQSSNDGGTTIYNNSTGTASDVFIDNDNFEILPPPGVTTDFTFNNTLDADTFVFTAKFLDGSTASSTCSTHNTQGCGDGALQTGEECDDGNTNNGDGCASGCTLEANYTCTGSPSVCTATPGNPICGDGKIQANSQEVCDDGNTNNGDGCSSACAVESGYNCVADANGKSVCTAQAQPTCGDGKIEGAEACDDHNTASSDGCSSTCTVEANYNCTGQPSICTYTPPTPPAVCGNAKVETGESCDDGNTTDNDGCTSTCTVEPNYTCNGSPQSICTPIGPVCGNGSIESGEACDDGNTSNGDGCAFNCSLEACYTCTGSPTSSCSPVAGSCCGNGVKQTGEGCDDGNKTSADGCSSTCTVEPNYTCTQNPQGKSSCSPGTGSVCGNGDIESGETCDDGNKNNGDGCSSTCAVESGFSCSGKPSICISTSNKYCICHNTGSGSNPYNTISISENAVCTHITQHADTAGPCVGEAISACKGDPPLPSTFHCSTGNASVCGNGMIESGEACDDGNTTNGNGCSSTCTVETGYTCTGSPSQCSANSTGGSGGIKSNGDGTVTVSKTCNSEFKVLCKEITYGADGPAIPVKMNRALNGTYFNNWMFNNSAVSPGQVFTEQVSSSQAATYKVKANAKYGSFNATYESTNPQQVKTLVNGSPAPTNWAGFGGQKPVAACVGPYTDSQTKKIKLAANQVLMLFELGVDASQYPNSPAADFQDLVVLITSKNCQ